MDAILSKKAVELAKELAESTTTLNELSEVMRSLMKTALERMLNSEMDVHLGGNKSDAEKSQGDDLRGEGPLPSPSKNRRNGYPNRDSALKLIYIAIHEASKKWTMPIPKWKEALNHFAIMFEGRMPKQLS